MIRFAVLLETILRDQCKVVKWIEFVDPFRFWILCFAVVDQPACDITVQAWWYGVEKILIIKI